MPRFPLRSSLTGDELGSPAGSPRSRSPSPRGSSGSRSPRKRQSKAQAALLRQKVIEGLLEAPNDPVFVCKVAEDLFFDSLPRDNVDDLRLVALSNSRSRDMFMRTLVEEGGDTSRVRCDEGHCVCGRYGRGGYVATSPSKANVYADS